MTFITPKPYISYKHIEAKSPQELELIMLAISVKSQTPTEFTPPSFSNNKWHSWFLYDFSIDVLPKDKLDMSNEDKL
jgi:hypothetical protein